MALTEEQLQHFYHEGYVVVPGLAPQASIDAVLAATPKPEGEGGGWGAHIFDHAQPDSLVGIHRLLVEPDIVDAARSIFGNEPAVFYGMLAVVKARGGNGLPWHQDNQYTQLLGGAINIFDRNTYHRSLKNETDQPRFAYAAQYQSQNSRDAQTGLRESSGIGPRLRAADLAAMWRRAGLL